MADTAKNLTTLLIGCLLAAGSGCHNQRAMTSLLLWGNKPDRLPGVVSPRERMDSLEKLATQAPSMPADQKQRGVEDLLGQLRKEEDPMLRAQLLRTLAAYGGPQADAALKAALNDPEVDVRIIACGLLGKRGGPEVVKRLSETLSGDADKDVRMAAARALGAARDPTAVAALGGALEDPDPAMQHRAVVALREVTGKDLGGDVDRWRAYVKDGSIRPAQPVSLARRLFPWIY